MEYHDFKASSEQDYEYEVDNFQNNRDQAFMASIQPDDEYEVDNYLNNSIGLCVCVCVCVCKELACNTRKAPRPFYLNTCL